MGSGIGIGGERSHAFSIDRGVAVALNEAVGATFGLAA
jgi:hypothetical protein